MSYDENFQTERQRPLMEAAATVQAAAAKAREMLEQFQAGWLWAFLTTLPSQNTKV